MKGYGIRESTLKKIIHGINLYVHTTIIAKHLQKSRNLFGIRFHLQVHSLLSWGLPWSSVQKMDENSLFFYFGMLLSQCAVCVIWHLFSYLSEDETKTTCMKFWNEKYGEYFFAMILNFCNFLLFLSFGLWSISLNRILFVLVTY